MGSSQAAKAASHERIVDASATQIRRGGLASLNVAGLMGDAGLTHGGFYRHFASRDALITEAVEAALERSSNAYGTAKSAGRPKTSRSLAEVLGEYLSRRTATTPDPGVRSPPSPTTSPEAVKRLERRIPTTCAATSSGYQERWRAAPKAPMAMLT